MTNEAELLPGTRLRQPAFASSYGVSRGYGAASAGGRLQGELQRI